jgi:hypothetical protein
MPIRVLLKMMRHRENLVVVEKISREHRADRLRIVDDTRSTGDARAVHARPMTAPFTGPVGTSNLYGTTAHGWPVVACNPTSPPVADGTYMSKSFRNSGHLHHENMLTTLSLNEIERQR